MTLPPGAGTDDAARSPETRPRASGDASDIRAGDWVDRHLPRRVRPYARLARLDRPIGIWLLMFPCWWSTALASASWPDPWFMFLFMLGAAIMRGAGCTLNDIIDRDFDARVARTATRPIPSGAISLRGAMAFMAALCLAGLIVLLQFNTFTVAVGTSSLLLVAIYPFAKRVTDWPQAMLGLTFNWGALVGWTAVQGSIGAPAILLYAAGLAWTLGYDTIYAHQDKEDDVLIGVRSTALRFGAATKRWLAGFYAASVVLLALAGATAGVGWAFWPLLAFVGLHFGWQIGRLDVNDPKNCLVLFKSNAHVGLMVFAAIVVGRATA